MVGRVTNMSAKGVRMSKVALSAAVMAVIWLTLDEFTDLYLSAAWVSGVTSLVMLVAQFSDFKAKTEGEIVYKPEDDSDG